MLTSRKHSPFWALVGFSTIVAAGILATPVVAVAADHSVTHSVPSASRKIWEDRGPIQQLDLYWANGSAERVPAGPYTFVEEELGGTNPKAKVRDANGVFWGVKWDEEKQAEVAASRLAWAMGLRVDETYYVPSGTIVFPGRQRPSFQRLGSFIDKQGNFKPARFKRWNLEQKSQGEWRFGENPLMDQTGYSVLVLMDVIMANWDTKDSNTRILTVPETTGPTDWYMIGDYGACFGKMGGPTSHSKYRLKDFVANPPVIMSVDGDRVRLGFKGGNASAHAYIPLEGARFFANRAAGLTLAQVEEAFRAANASEADRIGFAKAVYGRIQEVVAKIR
jgi:hypothetical protein